MATLQSVLVTPSKKTALRKRTKGLNTSVAEQVFSWFTGCAKSFNSMGSLHNKFLVLQHVRRNNAMMDGGDNKHFCPFNRLKKRASPTIARATGRSARGTERGRARLRLALKVDL